MERIIGKDLGLQDELERVGGERRMGSESSKYGRKWSEEVMRRSLEEMLIIERSG